MVFVVKFYSQPSISERRYMHEADLTVSVVSFI